MSIKVMLVDDHAVVRSGLAMLINAQPDMKVIAEAASGEEAFPLALETEPDVILMDLNLPGENGIALTGRIKNALPNTEIVVLTMLEDRHSMYQALKAGASGFIRKSAEDLDVMTAIRAAARGGIYLYPAEEKPWPFDEKAEENHDRNVHLTRREQEILALVAKGHSNKEIADMLHLSVKTVETHRSNLIGKLQLRTRAELVEYAIRSGLLTVE